MPESADRGRIQSHSEVVLVGRLGAKTHVRDLPSGDTVTVFTVVVDRPAREVARATGRVTTVDSIACQTFRAAVSRRVESIAPGEWVRVEGSLRRRFWRAGSGSVNVMEVDAKRVARVRMRP